MRKWKISSEDEEFLRRNLPECTPLLDKDSEKELHEFLYDAVDDTMDDDGMPSDFGYKLERIMDNVFWDNVEEGSFWWNEAHGIENSEENQKNKG